jgi:hypothetical protein
MRTMSGQERRSLVLAAALLVPLAILGVRAAVTPETTDFRCLWTGAAFVLSGRDPYDLADWTRATYSVGLDAFGRVRESNCFGSYPYPLTTAIAMVPLGALPLEIAAVIWEVLVFAGAVVGAALLAHAAGISRSLGLALVVIVLASQPFEQTVMSAQFGGLSLLALGLLAGPTLGSIGPGLGVLLAAMKPHVIPLVPLVRARGERARAILMALVPVTLIALVSLVLRPTWPLGWIAELTGQRREMFADAVSLWTLASVAGIPTFAPVLIAAGIVPMTVAAIRARDLHVLDAMAVAARHRLGGDPASGRHADEVGRARRLAIRRRGDPAVGDVPRAFRRSRLQGPRGDGGTGPTGDRGGPGRRDRAVPAGRHLLR